MTEYGSLQKDKQNRPVSDLVAHMKRSDSTWLMLFTLFCKTQICVTYGQKKQTDLGHCSLNIALTDVKLNTELSYCKKYDQMIWLDNGLPVHGSSAWLLSCERLIPPQVWQIIITLFTFSHLSPLSQTLPLNIWLLECRLSAGLIMEIEWFKICTSLYCLTVLQG